MSTVYPAPDASLGSAQRATFEKRWSHVKPLVQLQLAVRGDDDHLEALLNAAHQHFWTVCTTQPELLEVSSDEQWVQIALQGVLRINEGQSLFGEQFEIIERRLHNWARQHFKSELVEDIVQGAYIKLYEDYQRHQREWDAKHESFWVSCGKLAMRESYRELLSQTHSHRGSSRQAGPHKWVQQLIREDQFAWFNDEENDQNELMDLLSQRDEVDVHGAETRLANLRLDLETLFKTVQAYYRPAIFERCLLILERLAKGYTCAEIRLELGWTKVTYESTMTLIRRMSQFAEDYHCAPNRCAKLSEAEIARIYAMRKAGCTQLEIARRIGRDSKTVWRVLRTTITS